VENFVLATFMKIDREEKDLLGDSENNRMSKDDLNVRFKTLCFDYYRCSHFIELLSMFYENSKLSDEWEQKRKYC
jgi:hypothetical protein